MLVVDDTRTNLLKMKEKLLKITKGDRQQLLDEYKDLVISIDRDEYNALISKIKSTNYIDLPLEEQVSFFNDIIDNYNSLNEMQYRYRNLYNSYSDIPLKLSDISKIFIDTISERSSVIQGYLMNNKNLESNKVELEKLNLDLINALKKESLINSKINEINNSLKFSILSVEGRIIDNHNNMIYTSAVQEYKNAGLDLRELIENPDTLREEINRVTKERDENNETLAAAAICYKNNGQNEEVYNKIKDTVKNSEYNLVLLEIVQEICSETKEYYLMINKLNRLLNLIEERKLYLKVKFYIDPFTRIKIDEQLKVLEHMEDNTKKIANIRKTITYFTDNIANIENMNQEYLERINRNDRLFVDGNDIALPVEEPLDTNNVRSYPFEFDNDNRTYEINQVKKIRDLNDDFNIDRAIEKCNGVIVRVNELFGNKVEKVTKAPELVIEQVQADDEIISEETLPVENVFEDKPKGINDIFEENVSLYDTLSEPGEVKQEEIIQEDVGKEENKVDMIPEIKEDLEENVVPEVEEAIVTEPVVDNELFQEVKPFNEAPLFSERYEDVFDTKNEAIFDNNVAEVMPEVAAVPEPVSPVVTEQPVAEMPDAFWVTKEEFPNVESSEPDESFEENKVSFDEQIDKLINSDYSVKTKKKVA